MSLLRRLRLKWLEEDRVDLETRIDYWEGVFRANASIDTYMLREHADRKARLAVINHRIALLKL